jgi:hypothetical protein
VDPVDNARPSCFTCAAWRPTWATHLWLDKGDAADPDEAPSWRSAHDRGVEAKADAEEFNGRLDTGDLPYVELPGHCRRHAPHWPAGWPLSGADDDCGEYESKGERP